MAKVDPAVLTLQPSPTLPPPSDLPSTTLLPPSAPKQNNSPDKILSSHTPENSYPPETPNIQEVSSIDSDLQTEKEILYFQELSLARGSNQQSTCEEAGDLGTPVFHLVRPRCNTNSNLPSSNPKTSRVQRSKSSSTQEGVCPVSSSRPTSEHTEHGIPCSSSFPSNSCPTPSEPSLIPPNNRLSPTPNTCQSPSTCISPNPSTYLSPNPSPNLSTCLSPSPSTCVSPNPSTGLSPNPPSPFSFFSDPFRN